MIDLEEVLCGDGLCEERALAADALVDRLREVLEEELLLVRLHVRALDAPEACMQEITLFSRNRIL